MMNKRLNLNARFKQVDSGTGYIEIKGMASTNNTDRMGDVIQSEAWELQHFEKNPVILFNHNYNEPIGKATEFEVTEEGLEIKCKIYGEDSFLAKINEGVLNTFSVGFIFKDGKYDRNQDVFVITRAELLEVSVVSVPANPYATFSVAKALEKKEDLGKLKDKFGRESAKKTGDIKMDPENSINVDDIVAKLEERQIAREKKLQDQRKAEEEAQKAAEEAAQKAAAKAAEEAVQKVVGEQSATWVETSAEAVTKAFEKRLEEQDGNFQKSIDEFKTELGNFADEIKRMNDQKRDFGTSKPTDPNSREYSQSLIEAKLASVILGRDMEDIPFAKSILEKTGIQPNTTTQLDDEIGNELYKEIMLSQGVSSLFRRLKVNGKSTHIPVQPDVEPASFNTGGATDSAGRLQHKGGSDSDTYTVGEKALMVHRMISETHINDNTDETILIALMPMMRENVVRAHAIAVDRMIIRGNTNPNITGIGVASTSRTGTRGNTGTGRCSFDYDVDGASVASGNVSTLTADTLLAMRSQMGKWGLEPSDVTYIVPIQQYYQLLQDADFQDADQVMGDATKIRGSVGAVFGSRVVVSDAFADLAANTPVALAVNARGFVIPDLMSVRVERDREVAKQRELIVAAQQIGFDYWEAAHVAATNFHAEEAPCVALMGTA